MPASCVDLLCFFFCLVFSMPLCASVYTLLKIFKGTTFIYAEGYFFFIFLFILQFVCLFVRSFVLPLRQMLS